MGKHRTGGSETAAEETESPSAAAEGRTHLVLQCIPLNMATITGGLYYQEFLFSKKSRFLYKGINQLDILSGVYCNYAINYSELYF